LVYISPCMIRVLQFEDTFSDGTICSRYHRLRPIFLWIRDMCGPDSRAARLRLLFFMGFSSSRLFFHFQLQGLLATCFPESPLRKPERLVFPVLPRHMWPCPPTHVQLLLPLFEPRLTVLTVSHLFLRRFPARLCPVPDWLRLPIFFFFSVFQCVLVRPPVSTPLFLEMPLKQGSRRHHCHIVWILLDTTSALLISGRSPFPNPVQGYKYLHQHVVSLSPPLLCFVPGHRH